MQKYHMQRCIYVVFLMQTLFCKILAKFWRMILLLFVVFLLNWVWQNGKENSNPPLPFPSLRVSCCYPVDSSPEKVPTIDLRFGFNFLKFNYWSFNKFCQLLTFGNYTVKWCTCKQKRTMIYLVTLKKSTLKCGNISGNIVHFYCSNICFHFMLLLNISCFAFQEHGLC